MEEPDGKSFSTADLINCRAGFNLYRFIVLKDVKIRFVRIQYWRFSLLYQYAVKRLFMRKFHRDPGRNCRVKGIELPGYGPQ
jgi:hypothetical protein